MRERHEGLQGLSGECKTPANEGILITTPFSAIQEIYSGCCTVAAQVWNPRHGGVAARAPWCRACSVHPRIVVRRLKPGGGFAAFFTPARQATLNHDLTIDYHWMGFRSRKKRRSDQLPKESQATPACQLLPRASAAHRSRPYLS